MPERSGISSNGPAALLLYRPVFAAMKTIMRGEKGNEKREIYGCTIEFFEP